MWCSAQPLKDALAQAELYDPGLLRAYPRSSAAQLGFGDHAPPLDSRRRLTERAAEAEARRKQWRSWIHQWTATGIVTGVAMVWLVVRRLVVGPLAYRVSLVPSWSQLACLPFFLLLSPLGPLFALFSQTFRQRCRPRKARDVGECGRSLARAKQRHLRQFRKHQKTQEKGGSRARRTMSFCLALTGSFQSPPAGRL